MQFLSFEKENDKERILHWVLIQRQLTVEDKHQLLFRQYKLFTWGK